MSAQAAVPVVVVGAGPVGLCTALCLARRGISTVLLERERQLPADLRASTFHPPTLEMLEDLGLTGAILQGGLRAPTWQIRQHETHERAVFDLGVLAGDTRHPYRVQFEQAAFCRLALDAVHAEPRIRVSFGAEVKGMVRLDDAVSLSVTHPGGRDALRARYVVAADGAGSTLRRLLALPFEGLTYPETTVLVTTTFPFENHLPGLSRVNYVWIGDSNYALLRLPDCWRVSLYPDPDEDPQAEPWRMDDPARIEAKLQRIVPQTGRYEVLEHRPYRVHQRIVPTYHSGRVLLAGDAAHVNSPSGGMGMNCGIHDAFSLAEKLAGVFEGGSEDLLTLYDRQRRPVAADEILRQADRNRHRMRNADPAWRRAELARLQAIAADRDAARAHLLASSMIAGLRRAATIQ
ncbi:3-(3-hydroxy-phenyl)propionate hydroxylase [Gammaproteobacteria bacterium]|nr:3-(3-hydroxy-phenyl)propionate hydroxylase [Gammaproteobacteria bacterium]